MTEICVIGGGVNGLVAATRLAKAGRDVTLIERRDHVGGISAPESLSDGAHTTGLLHDTAGFAELVVGGLDLGDHGLRFEPNADDVLLLDDAEGILLPGTTDAASAALAEVNAKDADSYRAWRSRLALFGRVLGTLREEPTPDVLHAGFATIVELGKKAVGLRRLGKDDMLDLLRVAPMCVADWLNEWFESDTLKAGLAGPAVFGTWLAPWSPGSNLNLILHELAVLGRTQVAGGPSAVVAALEKAARANGVELRTGVEVERLILEGGTAAGVELAGGERIVASRVLATCDPRQTLLELLPPATLEHRDEHAISCFRARGTTAAMHMELTAPLAFEGRAAGSIRRARSARSLDDLERSFDPIKYRELPERPAIEVRVVDNVASLLLHWIPFDLEGGWTDARRDELGELALAELERHAPGVRDTVSAREVLTPADLAERYRLPNGQIHHGEQALDQLFLRPTPRTSRYATPIPGLFLGGSGSHPGGGVTGLPGWLSAGALLAG